MSESGADRVDGLLAFLRAAADFRDKKARVKNALDIYEQAKAALDKAASECSRAEQSFNEAARSVVPPTDDADAP